MTVWTVIFYETAYEADRLGRSDGGVHLAYLMFNLFTPPCFAAIGAMNAEIKQKKWLFGGICLQLGVGFTLGYLVYQIGTLITTGSFGAGFVGGLIAVAVMVAIVVYLCVNSDKKLKAEYALSGKK